MAIKVSEKVGVENPCVAYAKKFGIKVLKINPLWAVGWPDRIFFVPGGKPLLIEFKRPGGKLSKNQASTIRQLREVGYDVQVVDDPDKGRALIDQRIKEYLDGK